MQYINFLMHTLSCHVIKKIRFGWMISDDNDYG